MRTDVQSRLRPLPGQRPPGTPGRSSRLTELEIVAQKRQVTSVQVIGGLRCLPCGLRLQSSPWCARPRVRPPRRDTGEGPLRGRDRGPPGVQVEETENCPGRRWKRPRTARTQVAGVRAPRAVSSPENPRGLGSRGPRARARKLGVSPSPPPSTPRTPSHAPPSADGSLTAPHRLGPGLHFGRAGGAREPNCGGGGGGGREGARRGGD